MMDFSLLIAKWYRQNKRNLPWRSTKNAYFIWLSEIILQQTRIEQGKSYYEKFINHYPTIESLAEADEIDILNDWQGLGYYSRARNLHYSAKYIQEDLNGVFPSTYSEIIKLKGVGKYTAAAIASFAFDEEKAVVDGNVYRLLSRLFNIHTPIDSSVGQREFQKIADELIDGADPAIHNQGMMEIGSLICSPKPKCEICPLKIKCIAREKETIHYLPVKAKKTKVRNRYFHYLIYTSENKTIIEHRAKKDIWQNLYQFPLIELENANDSIDMTSAQSSKSATIKHVLSHQHIYSTFHHISGFPEIMDEHWVVIRKEDIQNYPLPRVIDRYLEKTSNA